MKYLGILFFVICAQSLALGSDLDAYHLIGSSLSGTDFSAPVVNVSNTANLPADLPVGTILYNTYSPGLFIGKDHNGNWATIATSSSNQVTSGGSAERIERATFDGGSANTNCTMSTGTCHIASQSGSWASLDWYSLGTYALTITGGLFSSAPTCTCSAKEEGSAPRGCSVSAISSTSAVIETWSDATNLKNTGIKLICMGPR